MHFPNTPWAQIAVSDLARERANKSPLIGLPVASDGHSVSHSRENCWQTDKSINRAIRES